MFGMIKEAAQPCYPCVTEHHSLRIHIIKCTFILYASFLTHTPIGIVIVKQTEYVVHFMYYIVMCCAYMYVYIYRVGRWRTACVCICMERLFAYLIHLCNSAPTLFTLCSDGVYVHLYLKVYIYLCGHIVCCRRYYTVPCYAIEAHFKYMYILYAYVAYSQYGLYYTYILLT